MFTVKFLLYYNKYIYRSRFSIQIGLILSRQNNNNAWTVTSGFIPAVDEKVFVPSSLQIQKSIASTYMAQQLPKYF